MNITKDIFLKKCGRLIFNRNNYNKDIASNVLEQLINELTIPESWFDDNYPSGVAEYQNILNTLVSQGRPSAACG